MVDKIFYQLDDIPVQKAKYEWKQIFNDCAALDLSHLETAEAVNIQLGLTNGYELFSEGIFNRNKKSVNSDNFGSKKA